MSAVWRQYVTVCVLAVLLAAVLYQLRAAKTPPPAPDARIAAAEETARAARAEAAGDWDRAEAGYRRALQADPSATEVRLALARMLAKGRGDAAGALEAYGRALAGIAAPDRRPPVFLEMAEIYLRRGDLDQAESLIGKALQADPGAEAFLLRAETTYRRGNLSDAAYHARTAGEIAPLNPSAQAWRACGLAREGRADDARAILERLPPAPSGRPAAARAWALVGDPGRALRILREHLDTDIPAGPIREGEREAMRRDPAFISLKEDPEFLALTGNKK